MLFLANTKAAFNSKQALCMAPYPSDTSGTLESSLPEQHLLWEYRHHDTPEAVSRSQVKEQSRLLI